MNLIVQIPCYNEESTIGHVLFEMPKNLKGVDSYKKVIIDDGSIDKTTEICSVFGVDHIIKHAKNQGLGVSFMHGIEYAYSSGADILVNTDGDNQYPGRYIEDLIKPILEGKADIVVGNRQTKHVKHFSITKKFFQWLGTRLVSILIGEPDIRDAVSGFRAYNRRSMRELNVVSTFSYVLDTTIQAKAKGLKIASVDITTNPPTRPSRLFSSNFQHIRKSAMDIIRVYAMYKGMRFFFWLGVVALLIGFFPILRYLYDFFYLPTHGEGKIQSLILGAALVIISALMFALGIIADLLSKNRTLIERVLNKQKDGL